MSEILVLDEFGSVDDVRKRKGIHAKDRNDYGVFMCHQFRLEKHILRGLMHLGFGNLIFKRSLKKCRISVKHYEMIIINEMYRDVEPFIRFIRENNPNARLIYQYWNPLPPDMKNRKIFIKLLQNRKKYDFVIVSFDKKDCKQYCFTYAPQYIPGSIEKTQNNLPIESDVFFIGKDKGRLKFLKTLDKKLRDLQISSLFWVLPDDKNKKYKKDEEKYLIAKEVPHKEALIQDQKCKAILDVVQKGQMGLTWRAVEALLLEKKLITTLIDIKNYDFYRKENIFILGEDNIEDLKRFLNSPYYKIPEEIMREYTFKGWCDVVSKSLG